MPDSNLVLCTDPDCDVAWAYQNPPTDHFHPHPHGPDVPSDVLTIVVRLPQHHGKVTALLDTLDRQWPGVRITGGNRIVIPADE